MRTAVGRWFGVWALATSACTARTGYELLISWPGDPAGNAGDARVPGDSAGPGDADVADALSPSCASDAACDDSNTCNGVERCVLGTCRSGRPPADFSVCTGGLCQSGACVATATLCSLYVDNTQGSASDTALAGASAISPLATLAYAFTRVAGLSTAAPRVVCVLAGTYDEVPDLTTSGTVASPVAVVGVGTTLVRGILAHADYVSFVGLTLDRTGVGSAHDGAGFGVKGAHITIAANTIGNAASPVDITGNDGAVLDNVCLPPGAAFPVYTAIRFAGDRHQIRGNTVDGAEYALQTYDSVVSSSDVVIDGNVLVNTAHSCLDSNGMYQNADRRLHLSNNICQGSGSVGFASQGLLDDTFVNNLVVGFSVGISYDRAEIATVNNLFVSTTFSLRALAGGSVQTSDNNMYVGASCDLVGPHDLCVLDAQFVDPGNPDRRVGYELTATSPAVDAGNDAFATALDLTGAPRSVDGDGDGVSHADIGPLELLPIH